MKKNISIILLTIALLTFTSCKEPCGNFWCHSGTMQCNECKGKGLELCSTCSGSGKCLKCAGTGTYRERVSCSNCDGIGYFINPYNWEQTVKCNKCDGSGSIYKSHICYWCDSDKKCDRCEGSGLADNNAKACKKCNGTGEVDCPDCEDGYIK